MFLCCNFTKWCFLVRLDVSTNNLCSKQELKRSLKARNTMSTKILNNKFNISETPHWSRDICDPERVDDILNRIGCNCELLKSQSPNDDYWKGTVESHLHNYLKECISGECNQMDLTEEIVRQMLKSGILRKVYYWLFNKKKFRLVRKIQNLKYAAKTMFPDILPLKPSPMEEFTVDYVQKVHQMIGMEVIQNAGKFRRHSAKPAQENFYYLEPNLIERKLENLLRECREVFSKPNLDLSDAVKYAACFLVEFLYIHPFPNGNGRVGRLLLSYLLTKYTVVPLPLYSSGNGRENYLSCLREAREPFPEAGKPASLARLIIENIDRAFNNLKFMMDL